MIKINGIEEVRVVAICDKVAKNHQSKKFESHTEEDIYQQAWVIILEKIDEFNDKKIKDNNNIEQALENFLNSVVSNRLSNFHRDNYVVKIRKRKSDTKAEHDKRISLSHPTNISEVQEKEDSSEHTFLYDEHIKTIFPKLSDESFDVLECILSGENVARYYKQKLIQEIKALNEELDE